MRCTHLLSRASTEGSSELLASCAPAAQNGADSAAVGNGRPERIAPMVHEATRACQQPAKIPAVTVSWRKPVEGMKMRRDGAGASMRSTCESRGVFCWCVLSLRNSLDWLRRYRRFNYDFLFEDPTRAP